MIEALFVFFGVAPSLAWLAYYLHQDNHPEPKRLVIISFLVGIVLSLPAIGLEFLVIGALSSEFTPIVALLSIGSVFWVIMAFIEEALKFIGMKWTIVPHPHFRQPIDAMVFMIITALGFAAAENTLFAFTLPATSEAIGAVARQGLVRGISATLLHAMASAVVGYFFARSIAFDHRHRWHLFVGLLTATTLHALYNFIIIVGKGFVGTLEILTASLLLIGGAALVSSMMRQLKQFPSFAAEHTSEHGDKISPTIS